MNKLISGYLWHLLRYYKVQGEPDVTGKVADSLSDLVSAIIQQNGFLT